MIIVVDDSGEKESRRLKEFIRTNAKRVIVLSRHSKTGRGSAVIDGMRRLMEHPSIRYAIEMDADLAHKPEEIRLFLNKRKGADVIIGSRYLKRSRIINWPLYRLVQSRIINMFLRIWLGLPITDYTNGFRLYSRRAVEILLASNLKESGYIALSEMAYVLKRKRMQVIEIPITFKDRTYGKSNADANELLRSLVGAFRIRFRHLIVA